MTGVLCQVDKSALECGGRRYYIAAHARTDPCVAVYRMRVGYLDIETNYVGGFRAPDDRFFRDYENHQITVLGLRVMDRRSDAVVQLVGREVLKSRLLEVLEGVQRLVTYNGRRFDCPVIAAQLGVVLDRRFRHIDLVPECWAHGLYGGQKKVEAELGLSRKLRGRGGGWAMETWRRYAETGDRKWLEELLLYNREDILMLREIELRLARR